MRRLLARFNLRPIRSDLLITIGLFLLPLAFFWQVTLGNRTLLPAENLYQFQPWAAYREQQGVPAIPHNSLLSDLVLENLPWKQFIRDSLANKELPLWNPYLFAGVPFLAAGQHSAMYPFSLIYYVLPLDKAYGWFTVSQLWLAGFFMYLLARGLGIRRFGATIAAIAYQLSGFFIASVVFQMIIAAAAWLPFLLLMVEFTIRRRPLLGKAATLPWIVLGAFGLGMEILAGHVEFTYYALLVMGFWAACRLGGIAFAAIRRGGSRTAPTQWMNIILRPAVSLLVMVALGVAVGAVQFIPLLELANHNFRAGSASFDTVRGYAYPPRHILAFLMPNIYGSPAQHTYFDVFSNQETPVNWALPDNRTITDTYWEVNKNYVEGACYVGLLTLFLAAIALLNARFERAAHARIETAGPYRAILAALSLISVSFIFGTPAYAILYYGLPGINQLHSPFRWVFPLTLCLAVLAGFGADVLQRARSTVAFQQPSFKEGAADSFTFGLARVMGWALIGIGLATVGLLLVSRVLFTQLHGPLDSLYHHLAGANIFPNVETFYSVSFVPILLFGLFLIGCGVVIRINSRPLLLHLSPRLSCLSWQALALAVLTLDLIIALAGFNPASDPAWLKFEPPGITWLKAQNPQDWRFTAIEAPDHTHTMNANVGWLYGLQDIRGYDSIIPKQYVDYMTHIQPQTQLDFNRIAPIFPDHLDALDSPLIDELGVKYVVSEIPIDLAAHPKYKQVYQDSAVTIYENSKAMPLAWIKTSIGVVPVKITESGRNQVVVEANFANDSTIPNDTPGSLILADSYFPGWRVYIRPQGTPDDQEKEIPVSVIDGNFRSVQIPPGAWTVRFRYTPPSVQLGAFTSFMALAVAIFAVLVWGWRRYYTEGEGEHSEFRRLAKNSAVLIVLNLFNRLIDFAFALIMFRLLIPADVGTYYYAVVIFVWFDILTNFGLNLLVTREVARNRSLAGQYLLNSSVLRVALALIGVPVLVVLLKIRLTLPEPLDSAGIVAIFLLYVGLIPNSISTGLTAIFYAFEKAEIPAATSTISSILKAGVGVAVLIAGWGIIGLAGISIALNVITLGILAWGARGLIRPPSKAAFTPTPSLTGPGEESTHGEETNAPPDTPSPNSERGSGGEVRLDRALIREMIHAGWPLMITHLLQTVFFKIDVVILEALKGALVVSQYSTAYKYLDAISVIPAFFTTAMLPIMARQAQDDKPSLERNYHFAIKLLMIVALPTAVAFTALAYPLINLLGGSRYIPDGVTALQLMVWFIPVGWINSLTNYVLVALDQQKAMRWAFLAGVSFNIITNLIFIPAFSFRASAIITILSEVVLQIAFYLLIRKALAPVPWIAILWKPIAAVIVMLGITTVLGIAAPALSLPIVIVAGLVYLGVLTLLRPFTAWELDRLSGLLPGPLRRLVRG